MARNIFVGLWMTVWPAVALLPPLVTAQGPLPIAAEVSEKPATKVVEQPLAAEVIMGPAADLTLETLPAAIALEAPSADPFEPELSDSPSTTQQVSRPLAKPIERAFDSVEFEDSEPLPTTGSLSSARSPRSTTPPKSIRRTGPQLSSQEERAQKLIQERAIARGKERHLRIAAKQWQQSIPRPAGQTTSWQPQLTQRNWLAEMDKITAP